VSDQSLATSYRTCPLCEATCGLEVTTRGDRVVRIRGDREDVFSHGFICPKGSTLEQLHDDPDRVRTPLLKRDGRLVPTTWDEAFAEVANRLPPLVERYGRNAVGVYIGNPTAHSLAGAFYLGPLLRALGTENRFSAATLDQMPKQVAAGYMFGTGITIPVPDVDRTDYLLMLGANPFSSNGSLLTAPDMPGRLQALRRRGGRLVVVDPRRSRTAEEADEHVAIYPGTDAQLLAALVNVLVTEGRVRLGAAEGLVNGLDDVARLVAGFTPERCAPVCGIEAGTIVRLARELSGARRAAVYGRIGTCTQEFGTLASWLVDVVNVLTGNLDREGGAMFPLPAAGSPNTQGRPRYGRGGRPSSRRTRVRGLPAVLGELPAACLAEEIDTPGDGRIRALVTIAGNPVLSAPNSGRLDAALAGLDLMVAVDIYVNESTRHADVVLPAPSLLRRSHYDVLLYRLAARNVANYSGPTLPLGPGDLDEWEILCRLALAAQGQPHGPDDVAALDEGLAHAALRSAIGSASGPVPGRDPAELWSLLDGRTGPERLLDIALRTGPYGDGFGTKPGGLTLAELVARPHGIDLGPLMPRLPDVLRTASGMVELAPEPLMADFERLRASLERPPANGSGRLVLVGRRDLRSNNSWMHNLEVLVRGRPRCTLHVNPEDAGRLGLVDGSVACVASRVGEVEVPVEVTDRVRQGVVSMPHGWGHDRPGAELRVAATRAGVNSNLLADDSQVDPLSGNAVLNGIPVTVVPSRSPGSGQPDEADESLKGA